MVLANVLIAAAIWTIGLAMRKRAGVELSEKLSANQRSQQDLHAGEPQAITYRFIGQGACRTSSGGLGTHTTFTAASDALCQAECSNNDACVAYEFRQSNGQCEIHTEMISAFFSDSDYSCYVKQEETECPKVDVYKNRLLTKCPGTSGWASYIEVEEDEWSTMCVPVINVNKKNCKSWCEGKGYECVRAQDNTNTGNNNANCVLDYTNAKNQNIAENGCLARYNNFLCQCGIRRPPTPAPPAFSATCNTFSCSGNTPVNKGSGTACSGSCNAATCCEARARCDQYRGSCSGNTPVKKGSGTSCSGNARTCNAATCCEAQAKCNTYSCPSNKPVNRGSGRSCSGNASTCNAGTCCEARATCNTYSCPSNKPVNRGSGTSCSGNASTCNAGTCCEAQPQFCVKIVTGTKKNEDGTLDVFVDSKKVITGNFARGSQKVKCFERISKVQFKSPTDNAWTGAITYSSDGGRTYTSLQCPSCTCLRGNPGKDDSASFGPCSNGYFGRGESESERMVVDGNRDSGKDADGWMPVMCQQGDTCHLALPPQSRGAVTIR